MGGCQSGSKLHRLAALSGVSGLPFEWTIGFHYLALINHNLVGMLGLQIDSIEAYGRFVSRVASSGQVWYLSEGDQVAFCLSNEFEDEETGKELDVILVWSDRAYALRCAEDDWAKYEPREMSLADFLDGWLINLGKMGALVGPNWTAELIGREVEPLELRERILEAIPAS